MLGRVDDLDQLLDETSDRHRGRAARRWVQAQGVGLRVQPRPVASIVGSVEGVPLRDGIDHARVRRRGRARRKESSTSSTTTRASTGCSNVRSPAADRVTTGPNGDEQLADALRDSRGRRRNEHAHPRPRLLRTSVPDAAQPRAGAPRPRRPARRLRVVRDGKGRPQPSRRRPAHSSVRSIDLGVPFEKYSVHRRFPQELKYGREFVRVAEAFAPDVDAVEQRPVVREVGTPAVGAAHAARHGCSGSRTSTASRWATPPSGCPSPVRRARRFRAVERQLAARRPPRSFRSAPTSCRCSTSGTSIPPRCVVIENWAPLEEMPVVAAPQRVVVRARRSTTTTVFLYAGNARHEAQPRAPRRSRAPLPRPSGRARRCRVGRCRRRPRPHARGRGSARRTSSCCRSSPSTGFPEVLATG